MLYDLSVSTIEGLDVAAQSEQAHFPSDGLLYEDFYYLGQDFR